MGVALPAIAVGATLFQRQRRGRQRSDKKRRSEEANKALLVERERELRRSGPQSSLRRVGLAPASDAGLPRLGAQGTNLLTGATGLPFNQQRR